MTNAEIIEAVRNYQAFPLVHPLTCGNDSMHEVLEPVEREGKVVLECRNCDYRQEHVPINAVLAGLRMRDELDDIMEERG